MADKRPSTAGAFIAVLGLGAIAVAIVAIALSFTASSVERIANADRGVGAIDLLEQRQSLSDAVAAEMAGSIADGIAGSESMLAAPLTVRRNAAMEDALAVATDLATHADSVGNEAQRWMSALTMETDPVDIDDAFERFVAYRSLFDDLCCFGVVPSDIHHTDILRDLEAGSMIPSTAWDYMYLAMRLADRSGQALPRSVDLILEHLGTPTQLAQGTQSPSQALVADLAMLSRLGVSQETINGVVNGEPLQTLDRVVDVATGRSDESVSIDEAYIAAASLSSSLEGLYGQGIAVTRTRLAEERETAEQVRLLATVVAPILLLVLVGIGIVVYRSARNREMVLKHEQQLLDARNRFMRMVSHELRTPATAISGFAQMLRTQWMSLTEAEISEFLAIVDRQSSHLSLIVDDLLTLSHLETGRLRLHLGLVNLKQAADDAIAMVDARYGIEVTASVDPDIVLVADPDRLVQILRNLVENAAKYGKTDIAVAATPQDNECSIVISDSGPGVPAEAADRMFRFWDRGAQETEKVRGHGMGLAIARHLARAMVGDLIYQPHQPIGSEFVLTLPLSRRHVAPVPAPDAAESILPIH